MRAGHPHHDLSYTALVHRFGMMLKSYGGDLDLARRCVESFDRFNAEHIPLTIVVPASDLPAFTALENSDITVLDESIFDDYLVSEPFGDMRVGYINQQIVKLGFWERDIYDDYFVVDSDMVFVRPFFRTDFMFDADTPYSVLVEDNDLQTDRRYNTEQWQSRARHLARIKELVELEDQRTLTCHNHQVFSGIVLHSLKEDFMQPNGYTYADLIELSPYEFSWYNFWLQESQSIPIVIREPLVKMLHHDGQHLEYALRGTTVEDVARGYLGLVINSSFARVWPDITPDEPTSTTVSRYVPASILLSALAQKIRLLPKLMGRKS